MMSKEYLEAFEVIRNKFIDLFHEDIPDFDTVENALKRLESIDNANPSEALECLRKLIEGATWNKDEFNYMWENEPNIPVIEQALLKAQKSLKALEIIKEKYVHIPQLLCAFENQLEEENPLEVYYNGQVGINVPMPLTQEEFNLLKEILE